MELSDYWQTIRKRWMLVVATLLVTLGAAAVFTWTAVPQYQSTTQLFVSTSGESDLGTAYTGSQFATQRATSYAAMVDDRQLAERVAAEMSGAADPDELSQQVQATVVPETVILQIAATDPDPVRAQTISQIYAEQLRDLIQELETPDGKQSAIIKATVVDRAQVPESPVSPQPLRNMGLALVLGLLLGVGLAVARELLDTSISSQEDVAEVTTTPVLGHVFHDHAAQRVPSETLRGANPWSESFRVLRTNMQYLEVDHDQLAVVVTSAVPEEGKTTTAVNLAVTMAMGDQRVALVECDLRRPLMAQRMNLDPAVGTTSVLVGKLALDDALQTYDGTSLQVLACGPVPPNPSELLQSHAMEKLLLDLRERFDVVILDAPPLLPVTDASLLATRADGAVLVVRHARTGKEQLRHALDRLEAVDAKALGVIMAMTPSKRRFGRYGGGYGYGYGYGAAHDQAVGGRASKRAVREQKAARKAAARAESRAGRTKGSRRA